jgi:RNA recognition motif-containing protein
MSNNKLHVGNLATETTAAAITEAFQRDGRQVASVKLVMSRDPQHSRGFAFVEMATEADALATVDALHGATIDGREIRVSLAHPPKSRFGGTIGTRL